MCTIRQSGIENVRTAHETSEELIRETVVFVTFKVDSKRKLHLRGKHIQIIMYYKEVQSCRSSSCSSTCCA